MRGGGAPLLPCSQTASLPPPPPCFPALRRASSFLLSSASCAVLLLPVSPVLPVRLPCVSCAFAPCSRAPACLPYDTRQVCWKGGKCSRAKQRQPVGRKMG